MSRKGTTGTRMQRETVSSPNVEWLRGYNRSHMQSTLGFSSLAESNNAGGNCNWRLRREFKHDGYNEMSLIS